MAAIFLYFLSHLIHTPMANITVLKNQGIVESRKDGSKVIYSIKNKEVYQMLDLAEKIILRQIEETKSSLLN